MQAGETESPKAHSVMMVVKGDGRYRGGCGMDCGIISYVQSWFPAHHHATSYPFSLGSLLLYVHTPNCSTKKVTKCHCLISIV